MCVGVRPSERPDTAVVRLEMQGIEKTYRRGTLYVTNPRNFSILWTSCLGTGARSEPSTRASRCRKPPRGCSFSCVLNECTKYFAQTPRRHAAHSRELENAWALPAMLRQNGRRWGRRIFPDCMQGRNLIGRARPLPLFVNKCKEMGRGHCLTILAGQGRRL